MCLYVCVCVGDCVFVCLLSSIAENNSVPFAANAEFMLSSQGLDLVYYRQINRYSSCF